jgi:hypothetical protein
MQHYEENNSVGLAAFCRLMEAIIQIARLKSRKKKRALKYRGRK